MIIITVSSRWEMINKSSFVIDYLFLFLCIDKDTAHNS